MAPCKTNARITHGHLHPMCKALRVRGGRKLHHRLRRGEGQRASARFRHLMSLATHYSRASQPVLNLPSGIPPCRCVTVPTESHSVHSLGATSHNRPHRRDSDKKNNNTYATVTMGDTIKLETMLLHIVKRSCTTEKQWLASKADGIGPRETSSALRQLHGTHLRSEYCVKTRPQVPQESLRGRQTISAKAQDPSWAAMSTATDLDHHEDSCDGDDVNDAEFTQVEMLSRPKLVFGHIGWIFKLELAFVCQLPNQRQGFGRHVCVHHILGHTHSTHTSPETSKKVAATRARTHKKSEIHSHLHAVRADRPFLKVDEIVSENKQHAQPPDTF